MKGHRRCAACGKDFRPRNRLHVYCNRETCRASRRKKYMQGYMAGWKRKHPNYWKTERQREYMKEWREAHPDYFRDWRQKRKSRGRAKSK